MMQHYFDQDPQAEHQEKRLQVKLFGRDFEFITDTNVFSRHALDYGTRVLIEAIVRDGQLPGRLLDLGCGYGPVGIVLKRMFPHLDVEMSDINRRAVELTRKNLAINQIKYVKVQQSDGFEQIEGTFDTITLNPPIRAGKKTVHSLFEQSYQHLNIDGQLYVVIQKKQGAPSALKALQNLSASVERISRDAGYWVLRVKKTQV
jgi:16S rRNA (guanine1207-N2)-methyltransferase